MNTERKILANLAWRVYKARHKLSEYRKLYSNSRHDFLYSEVLHEWLVIYNAFQAAKQIYFDNQPKG
jgi:hypothetical protein